MFIVPDDKAHTQGSNYMCDT